MIVRHNGITIYRHLHRLCHRSKVPRIEYDIGRGKLYFGQQLQLEKTTSIPTTTTTTTATATAERNQTQRTTRKRERAILLVQSKQKRAANLKVPKTPKRRRNRNHSIPPNKRKRKSWNKSRPKSRRRGKKKRESNKITKMATTTKAISLATIRTIIGKGKTTNQKRTKSSPKHQHHRRQQHPSHPNRRRLAFKNLPTRIPPRASSTKQKTKTKTIQATIIGRSYS